MSPESNDKYPHKRHTGRGGGHKRLELCSQKPRVVPEPPKPGIGEGKFSLEPSEGAATLTLDLRSPEL